VNSDISSKEREIDGVNSDITTTKQKMDDLRTEYNNVFNSNFQWDESKSACPTCKREIENLVDKKAEFETNFNTDKVNKLSNINAKGKNMTTELGLMEKKLSVLDNDLATLKSKKTNIESNIETERTAIINKKVPNLTEELLQDDVWKTLKNELEKQESELGDAPKVDISELQDQKRELQNTIDEKKKLLNSEDVIEKAKSRIKELEKQESELSQELSTLEKQEFIIDNFIKSKADKIESIVNTKFTSAKFKLFETQINGAKVPCCITLYKGVPFSDLNNAAKTNIGIDIINTLSDFYQGTAPIIIDNREGINQLIETKGQIINLVVSKDPKLTIK